MSASEPKLLDFRGYRCPLPVIRLEAALRKEPETRRFLVIADDPVAAVDIPHFCREAGHMAEPGLPSSIRTDVLKASKTEAFCVFLVTRGDKSGPNS